jgi:hypothetical protein
MAVMSKISVALLAVTLLSQVVRAQDTLAAPKGPPPRFVAVASLDRAKGEVVFDVQFVAQRVDDQLTVLVYPGGDERLTLGTKPSYVHLGEGFKVSLKKAKWSGADGKGIGTDAASKRLKPGVIVLLSADGGAVDGAYLRVFKEDTLVLVVAAEELPVPYIPHSGDAIPIRKVGER